MFKKYDDLKIGTLSIADKTAEIGGIEKYKLVALVCILQFSVTYQSGSQKVINSLVKF